VVGAVGVLVGSWITIYRDNQERRHKFIKQQCEEFYAPMVGLRREIRAKSEARLRIRDNVHAVRAKKRESGEWTPAIQREHDDRDKLSFESLIDYDNKQLAEEIIPAFRQMRDLFRERGWLAELRAREHHQELVEFVEIWNRVLKDSVPLDAINHLNMMKQSLNLFIETSKAILIACTRCFEREIKRCGGWLRHSR